MADSFIVNAPSSGASAAGTILTEDVSFNAELTNVSLSSSATTTTAVVADVRKNGTSVFTGQTIGNIQTGATAQGAGASVSASQPTIDVLPTGKNIEAGSVLLVESEQMLVTGVQGSPVQVGSGQGVQRLTVTRGYNGTTGATHAANVAVSQALPTLPNASTTTGTLDVNSGPQTQFAEGDTLTVVVVSGTGATNFTASLAFERV